MGKNIYDLFNDINIDFSEYDEEALTDIERKHLKKAFKKSIKNKNHSYKKYMATALIGLLAIGFLGNNIEGTVWANIHALAYDIAGFLRIEKNLDEYKTVLNQSITKKGVTIKLNEVILDHNELVVSNTISTDEQLKDNFAQADGTIYINGRMASYGAGGAAQKIDDHTIQEVMAYELTDDDIKGDLNIKIVFSNVTVNGDTKSGNWVFEFKTNGDELALDTQEILLNHTFTLPNKEKVTLEKYTSNHLGQKIYYHKDKKNSNSADYDMILKGHDDLGSEINFYLSSESDGHGIFKLTNIDRNLNENAKVLTLALYAVKFPEKSGKLSNDFKKVGEEFTIHLSK
ncbi:DUF4179 domain-containing protein [Inediibacterium massiliense]|uniref:DUF4179 domain-containing protein n=1 Tax=Inediibacterium massiliense TaxID=1658111 RepID=UPI0006B61E54|nr:DUF4179 domain-containing protein [Inediibacterium massiliense]